MVIGDLWWKGGKQKLMSFLLEGTLYPSLPHSLPPSLPSPRQLLDTPRV